MKQPHYCLHFTGKSLLFLFFIFYALPVISQESQTASVRDDTYGKGGLRKTTQNKFPEKEETIEEIYDASKPRKLMERKVTSRYPGGYTPTETEWFGCDGSIIAKKFVGEDIRRNEFHETKYFTKKNGVTIQTGGSRTTVNEQGKKTDQTYNPKTDKWDPLNPSGNQQQNTAQKAEKIKSNAEKISEETEKIIEKSTDTKSKSKSMEELRKEILSKENIIDDAARNIESSTQDGDKKEQKINSEAKKISENARKIAENISAGAKSINQFPEQKFDKIISEANAINTSANSIISLAESINRTAMGINTGQCSASHPYWLTFNISAIREDAKPAFSLYGGSVGFTSMLNNNFGLTAEAGAYFGSENSADHRKITALGGVSYFFNPSKFQPQVHLLGGITNVHSNFGSYGTFNSTAFTLAPGVNFSYYLSDHVALGVSVDDHITNAVNNMKFGIVLQVKNFASFEELMGPRK